MTTAVLFLALAAVGTTVRVTAGTMGSGLRGRVAGTLAVNLSGAFLVGLLAGSGPSDAALTVLGVGGLGSLTTFSTMMLDTVELSSARQRTAAAGYLAVTVVGAVLLADLGMAITG